MFLRKAEAYPDEAPFRCSTQELAPMLSKKIRLDWKDFSGTNTPAYYNY